MTSIITPSPRRLRRRDRLRLNWAVSFGLGIWFVLAGLLGFAVAAPYPAVGHAGGHLFWLLEVNVLHNVVHLVIGVAMVVASFAGRLPPAVTNVGFGAVYLLTGVFGMLVPPGHPANVLALNTADNLLHLGLGGLICAVGIDALVRLRRNYWR